MLIAKKAHIQRLDLFGCRKLSDVIEALDDDALQRIFGHCESLDLSWADITESALQKLLPHLGAIKTLNLQECTNLSAALDGLADEALRDVFASCEVAYCTDTRLSDAAFTRLSRFTKVIR